MITKDLYSDMIEQIKEKVIKSHGGFKFMGFYFLSKKAKKERKRVMDLKWSEIKNFVMTK